MDSEGNSVGSNSIFQSTYFVFPKLEFPSMALDLSGMNEIPQILSASIQGITSDFYQAFAPFYDPTFQMTINSSFQEIAEIMRDSFRELATELYRAFIPLHDFHNWIAEFTLEVSNHLQYLSNVVDIFDDIGWPVAPSMPLWFIDEIVELHNLSEINRISSKIRGYYRRENFKYLNEAVKAWNRIAPFRLHMRNIERALEAHQKGWYAVSIPTLMLVLEGVMKHYDPSSAKSNAKKLAEKIIHDPESYPITLWATAKTLLKRFSDEVYVNEEFDRQIVLPVKRRLKSRHNILHGINPRYASESGSLKYFLYLEGLFALLEFNLTEFD